MADDKPKLVFYCLAVKLCVKPERRDEFLECIANNQRGTLSSAEPLALEYKYGEDATTPNTFHFFEKYKGKEGFEAHTKAPHFVVWEKFAATDPFTSPPEIAFFEEVGPAPNRGCGKGKGKGKGKSSEAGYCLNVHLNIKPDRRDDFLSAIKDDQKGTVRNERLAMNFLIGQDTSDENQFHLFERYVGKVGFEAHCASEHFAEWKKAVDSGIAVSDPVVCFYNEAQRAPVLNKPKFGKVKSINPDSKGLNLLVKCVKCEEVEGGSTKSWRAVLGDDTGVATFSLRDAAHAALCKEGSSLRVQNARTIMMQGHIYVIVDKFGVLKAADEAVQGDVGSKDVSATEYELALS